MKTLIGLLLPFLGTTLGAACVFFVKGRLSPGIQKSFLGFASGVMVAASVWSLLIPSMEMCGDMGKLSVMPAAVGFLLGVGALLAMDHLVPHLHQGCENSEGPACQLKKTTMLVLAVTSHNIPEGLSAGAVLAGAASGNSTVTMAGAITLSVGIAIQNFPEGAIISMPMRAGGVSKGKAFLYGMLSGIVEPAAGALMLILAAYMLPVLPYLLGFAAGAMLYVVVEELIPEANGGDHSNVEIIAFALGFVLMMVLDVVLG